MALFTGNWRKLRRYLRRMTSRVYMKDLEKDLDSLGKSIQLRVQDHIDQQDLDWVPLSIYTIGKKGHDKIYLETKFYRNNVQVKVKRAGAFSLNLSVAVEGTHEPSGESMQDIATWLEYGTSLIPARPLWRPTFAEVPMMPEFKSFADLRSKVGFSSV